MAKESAKQKYEQIQDSINHYARDHYGGAQEKGFRHWAFYEIFLENNLSDAEIIDATRIDGPDDFEVDGYRVEDSEEEKVIHLFQSKHRAPGKTVGDDDITVFLNAPEKLLNRELVAGCANEETKALHDEIVRLIPKGVSLHLVWATSGTPSPKARKYVEENTSRTIQHNINGTSHSINVTLEAFDLTGLVTLFQTHKEGDSISEPVVTLELGEYSSHEVPGDYNTLNTTIPARRIVEVFEEHRYKIFRLNPRGPLGNKTNSKIKKSLHDETERHMFHLLNNGLTAICASYKRENSTVKIRDFQIVNGCQTTVTLWSVRAIVRDDPKILINLKLIECPPKLHTSIATTTNTQAPLRAEDFISTDKAQDRLQQEFDVLDPSWFYQTKRSQWSRMTDKSKKQKYLGEDDKYRWLKSKDVAQAFVAFLGFPGEAKDKIRFFFEDQLSSEYGQISYAELYDDISANQLLLPTLLYKKIAKMVERDRSELGPTSDWLDYSRFHLLWLVAESLRTHYGSERTPFPRDRSQSLIASVDDWIESLYLVARIAIDIAVSARRDENTYRGHREFFRSQSNYPYLKDKLPTALAVTRSGGSNPLSKLPS